MTELGGVAWLSIGALVGALQAHALLRQARPGRSGLSLAPSLIARLVLVGVLALAALRAGAVGALIGWAGAYAVSVAALALRLGRAA